MATVVEISNTRHRTYSPLDEKHNILYSRAKRNFNYRHVQKPWFNVNPFLDKDVTKGESIDKYKPENDAGIMHAQSLVIVENYFQDRPLLTKEFSTREFWDFLFSDDWTDGNSVRVFVGQLQHLLSSCLVTMCQSGNVVQHSTVAYAKNLRQKYTVNQFTDKETEYAGIEETLLLEFIYYGHKCSNKAPWIESVSSFGYPERSTTHSSSFRPSTDVESSDHAVTLVIVPKPPSSPPGSQKRPSKHRLRSIEINSENLRNCNTYFDGELEEYSSNKIMPIPRGPNYRQTCSNFSNSSDEFRYKPVKIDLSKFKCTEKVPCLGWFNLADDSSDESSASDDDSTDDSEEADFKADDGEQMYLGDAALRSRTADNIEDTHTKLKKRKEIVQNNRELRKNVVKAQPPRDTIMRELSELDVNKYVKNNELSVKIAQVNDDDALKFEDYVKMLDPEEQNEADLRLKKKFSRVGRNESTMFKSHNRRPGFQRLFGNVMGTHVEEKNIKETIWKMSEPVRRTFLMGQLNKGKKKKNISIPPRTNFDIPLIYITTVSGVTFLHPISQQQWKKLKLQEKANRSKDTLPTTTVKRRQSVLPTHPTALARELSKSRRSIISNGSTVNNKFPKATPMVIGVESPDMSDSEEEEDVEQEYNGFNTDKLNIRYSIERIKRLKKERSKSDTGNKEKNDIYSKLRKYFRMQSILKALCKPPPKKRRGSILTRRNPVPITFGRKQPDKVIKEDTFTVGKLKTFSFLEKGNKLSPREIQVASSPFDNYPMQLFKENMERALKEFVVRREIVISDYNGRTSVSITFTKKDVFTKSKYSKK